MNAVFTLMAAVKEPSLDQTVLAVTGTTSESAKARAFQSPRGEPPL